MTQDDVKQIIAEVVGQKGEMGEPIIRNITLAPDGGGTAVTLDLNRTDCPMIGMHMVCSADQLPGVAATMTRSVMSILFEYTDVTSVQINLYSDLGTMIDMNSTSGMNEVLVARTMISRDAGSKMDWSLYNASNAANLATSYWLDPGVPLTGLSSAMSPAAGATPPAAGATTPASPAAPPAASGPGSGSSSGSMPGMPGM